MCFQSIIILPVCCQQYIRSVTYLPMTRIILLFYIIDHDHIIFWACGVIQVLIWLKPALCARAGTVHKAALGPFIPSDKRLDSLAIEGLQGMSFLLVRECVQKFPHYLLHFFGVRSLNKRHGFPERTTY